MLRKIDCILLVSESNVKARKIWKETYKRLKELVEIKDGFMSIFDGEGHDQIINNNDPILNLVRSRHKGSEMLEARV